MHTNVQVFQRNICFESFCNYNYFELTCDLFVGKVLRSAITLSVEALQSKLMCKSYDETKFQTHMLAERIWLLPSEPNPNPWLKVLHGGNIQQIF